MPNEDVPDSTDWLSTPLSGLAAVESALRCQVCKDFYNTPMITSCSHTFCSLCIRRVLAVDSKCPLCRTTEQEMKLRSNWSMEEAVDAFVKARPAALELARKRPEVKGSSPKRKAADASVESETAPESKRLRTSARLSRSRAEQAPANPEPLEIEEEEEDYQEFEELPGQDDDYVPEPADGLVPCPSCQNRMKEWQVFKHLEACPGPIRPEQKRSESSPANTLSQAQRQDKKLERLPALSYSMLKEAVLRKKMWELGLDNSGSRSVLERRHKEWTTLWNANCDAARPKSRSKLMSDLRAWETAQNSTTATGNGVSQRQPAIKNKDFDGEAWAAKHDSSFKDLIAIARKSREDAQKKKTDAQEAPDRTNTLSTPPTIESVASSVRDPLLGLDKEDLIARLTIYRSQLRPLSQPEWETLGIFMLSYFGYVTRPPAKPSPAAPLPAALPQTFADWESLTRAEVEFYGPIAGTINEMLPEALAYGVPQCRAPTTEGPTPTAPLYEPSSGAASAMDGHKPSTEDTGSRPAPGLATQNTTSAVIGPPLGPPASSQADYRGSAASASWPSDQVVPPASLE